MRLKHGCPAPAKFGSAEPLWKTAMVNYLKAVRDVVSGIETLGECSCCPDRTRMLISFRWRQTCRPKRRKRCGSSWSRASRKHCSRQGALDCLAAIQGEADLVRIAETRQRSVAPTCTARKSLTSLC